MSFMASLRNWTDILLEREDEDSISLNVPEEKVEIPKTEENPNQVRVQRTPNNNQRSKVMGMQAQNNAKMSWHRPRSYNQNDDARKIANDLNNDRSVILNLEDIDKKEARRLLDFLSGVAYARSSIIKKVGVNIFLFGPYDLDFEGDDIMTMVEENSYL